MKLSTHTQLHSHPNIAKSPGNFSRKQPNTLEMANSSRIWVKSDRILWDFNGFQWFQTGAFQRMTGHVGSISRAVSTWLTSSPFGFECAGVPRSSETWPCSLVTDGLGNSHLARDDTLTPSNLQHGEHCDLCSFPWYWVFLQHLANDGSYAIASPCFTLPIFSKRGSSARAHVADDATSRGM